MNDWHFPRTPPPGNSTTAGIWTQMLARDNVLTAWEKVRRNRGAPGVDGVRIDELAPCFELEWAAVDSALRRGDWQPHPVRRVSVPKAGGGQRHLGIPTVMDRVVHQALSQVLTPLWEERFSPHSFAYRRGLGTREALTDLVAQAQEHSVNLAWHLDLRDFFDSVPHPQAVRVVKRVTDDVEPLRLVQRILAVGVFADGQVQATHCGVPQGSPLSPLLANGVLHTFDLWLADQSLPFVRYADDIVILLPPGQTPARWQPAVTQRLAMLGLSLNETKTTHGSLDGLKFLGFSLFQDSQGAWRRRVAPTSWAALEAELARRGTGAWAMLGEDESTPADYLAGWIAHFGITEFPGDRERIAALLSAHGGASSPTPKTRVKIPYTGATSASSAPLPHRSGPWRQTLRLWVTRAIARRWVRVGLDWGRGRRGFPLQAVHITLGPFNFRFRL